MLVKDQEFLSSNIYSNPFICHRLQFFCDSFKLFQIENIFPISNYLGPYPRESKDLAKEYTSLKLMETIVKQAQERIQSKIDDLEVL